MWEKDQGACLNVSIIDAHAQPLDKLTINGKHFTFTHMSSIVKLSWSRRALSYLRSLGLLERRREDKYTNMFF